MYWFHSFSGDTRVSVKREGLVLEQRLALSPQNPNGTFR
jgi:hypothetical protein